MTAQLVLNPNTAVTTSKTSFTEMPFLLIALVILLSNLLMMIGHCLSLIHKRNQWIKALLMYQTHYHYINHLKWKSYTPSNPILIPLHEVTWEHMMKKSINLPLKEHFQNIILMKIAPLQVHKLTCREKNTVKQCILYNTHNRTIGTNGSIVEWTWKVDFIDPLALEIHIQGYGSFYLFGYEYFRNQCIHIVRDKWTDILYTLTTTLLTQPQTVHTV